MDKRIESQYQTWLKKVEEADIADDDVLNELKKMRNDSAAMEDAFYRNLEFGTGGLRGVIGAGTNRMNVYTVAKASQGVADYVKKHYPEEGRKIAISYDSRIKSELFAKVTAGVFAANGMEVKMYDNLMPTPCLSFAVRALSCAVGIMITASHNPAKYNGYKVYGDDGCQITTAVASEMLEEIEKLDIFEDVLTMNFEEGIRLRKISYITEVVYTAYIEAVKKQSVLGKCKVDKNVTIVYSPLNGTGLKPVQRTLEESGYRNIIVVKEQENPDGHFPTCPYPNPEIKEAMALGIQYAKKYNADLLLATDPDCDRVGIAVKDRHGKYILLSGNEVGLLLLDYICSRRQTLGIMPVAPVFIKTIVTTDMAERIAAYYGVKTINVLTGFKFIGEQIGQLEAQGREEDYIFGFEESYGYLAGSYVRDKDAVVASLMICDMFAYYKALGIRLTDRLEKLYEKFGYCLNSLHSFEFEGQAGFEKMQNIMKTIRKGVKFIGSNRVLDSLDYGEGLSGLPKANVVKFLLDDNCSIVVRPSGTEPKLKMYLSISAINKAEAEKKERDILEGMKGHLQ